MFVDYIYYFVALSLILCINDLLIKHTLLVFSTYMYVTRWITECKSRKSNKLPKEHQAYSRIT